MGSQMTCRTIEIITKFMANITEKIRMVESFLSRKFHSHSHLQQNGHLVFRVLLGAMTDATVFRKFSLQIGNLCAMCATVQWLGLNST